VEKAADFGEKGNFTFCPDRRTVVVSGAPHCQKDGFFLETRGVKRGRMRVPRQPGVVERDGSDS